jgi:hypothetical protein
VAKDQAEAAKWFRKAAEQGNAQAQNILGILYRDGKGVVQDFVEAVKWYRKAAAQRVTGAQWDLGLRYLLGEGVSKDDFEAYKWLRLAVEHGYKDTSGALIMAGSSYSSRELQEAERWVRAFKSSNQGPGQIR